MVEVDAKAQVVILVLGLGGAAYLAGYDPLGIVLGWGETALMGIVEWFEQLIRDAVGGITASLRDALSF